uniref:Cell death inducing DFFA like effector a n=1 Tax=Latimeria chalumnae TaxID=7897 RepID=H3A209_LATCH
SDFGFCFVFLSFRSVSSVSSSLTRRVLFPPPPPSPRPFRLCNHDRSSRKGIVAGTLKEFISKALDALLITSGLVTLVLEEDGTVIDTEEFFQSLEDNTCFMLLERGQKWAQIKGGRVISGIKYPKKKGVAKITFDLYKLHPKEFIGRLNIRATFYEIYSMSYDIRCNGAKHVLKKLLRVVSYLAQVTGQFLIYGSSYVLQLTGEYSDDNTAPSSQSAQRSFLCC